MVPAQRLVARGGNSRRSVIGITGDGSNVVLLSWDYRYPYDNNLHAPACASFR